MWVYTGTGLVNITGAQEITIDRETAGDRQTSFIVAADFGDRARIALARVEMVFPESLVVALGAGEAELRLTPRERAEQRARAECDACLRALAAALAAGRSYCDLSGLYTPILRADLLG